MLQAWRGTYISITCRDKSTGNHRSNIGHIYLHSKHSTGRKIRNSAHKNPAFVWIGSNPNVCTGAGAVLRRVCSPIQDFSSALLFLVNSEFALLLTNGYFDWELRACHVFTYIRREYNVLYVSLSTRRRRVDE